MIQVLNPYLSSRFKSKKLFRFNCSGWIKQYLLILWQYNAINHWACRTCAFVITPMQNMRQLYAKSTWSYPAIVYKKIGKEFRTSCNFTFFESRMQRLIIKLSVKWTGGTNLTFGPCKKLQMGAQNLVRIDLVRTQNSTYTNCLPRLSQC
jgi:hypothetical protein